MKIILLSPLFLFLSGCLEPGNTKYIDNQVLAITSRLSELENRVIVNEQQLGEYRYLALDPQLSFTVENVKFVEPKSEYGSYYIKAAIDVTQHNSSFVPDIYGINVQLEIFDKEGFSIFSTSTSGKMKNGIDAIALDNSLYGINKDDFTGHTLKVTAYSWYPINKFEPFKLENESEGM